MKLCEFMTCHDLEFGQPGEFSFSEMPCPDPATCAGEGEWWHLWGSAVKWVDDKMQHCPDEEGEAYVNYMVGPMGATDSQGNTPLKMKILPGLKEETDLKYLASWNHHPTDQEINAVKPEQYRDEETTNDDDAEA